MSLRILFRTYIPGLVLLTLMGCPPADQGSKAPANTAATSSEPSAADLEEAKKIFGQRCAVCHGPTGAGDGAASSGLDPKPRNFTDPAWQTSVTDEYIEKITKYGGTAVGKSAAMPGNPDLSSKAGIIAGLRIHIRSLQSK